MDKHALLFNLTNNILFPCKQKENALYCHNSFGPYFGGEKAELSVQTDSDGSLKCVSHTGQKVFQIEKDKNGKNALTGETNDEFKISSMEVWEIQQADFKPSSAGCSIF